MRAGLRGAWAAVLALLPAAAGAHAFGERYDLPAPLAYFVLGAAATVALTFVVAIAAVGRTGDAHRALAAIRLPAASRALALALRALGLALFALALASGFLGDSHPARNIAPTLVWIVGWAGLSLFAALVGDPWPLLDPWRTLHDVATAIRARLGGEALVNERPWNPRWGGVPAAALFLLLAWLEFVDPLASRPSHLAALLLAWTVVNLGAMAWFGPATWRRHGDPVAIYFAALGRFAPVGARGAPPRLELRPWGRALAAPAPGLTAAFVVAMLSTVLFDGLMGTSHWRAVDTAFATAAPGWNDRDGLVLGTAGLLGSWAFFLAAYGSACAIASRLAGRPAGESAFQLFARTLIPIAVAYQLAHNFSYVLVQGQNVFALLSDPLGRGWNLFGTAGFVPDMGLVDARVTWFVATGAIVTGHVISVWLAHRVALDAWPTRGRAILASIPLTVLMVLYTAASLAIVSEPLTRFRSPDASYSERAGTPTGDRVESGVKT